MAAFNMKIRDVSIGVEMGLWEDDCGNPCVYLKNPDDEYLSCHEDGKHIFWHAIEDEDAWAWEMWYPEYTNSGVFLKSYHDTYMTSDSEEDGRMWQCDEHHDVYVEMTKSEYDELMKGESDDEEETDESDKENSEESDKEDDEPVKKPEKKEKKSDDDDKPKRTIDPEVHRKGAIARKVKTFIESECKDELDGLKGKERSAKKTELYQKHKNEKSDLYKKLYKKAEKEV